MTPNNDLRLSFCSTSSPLSHKRKKVIQTWNNMRVNIWQTFHFSVNPENEKCNSVNSIKLSFCYRENSGKLGHLLTLIYKTCPNLLDITLFWRYKPSKTPSDLVLTHVSVIINKLSHHIITDECALTRFRAITVKRKVSKRLIVIMSFSLIWMLLLTVRGNMMLRHVKC